MFRFEEPAYLSLLLLLPLLAAFYLYSNYRRRRNIRKFGDPVLMAQLMPDVSKYRPDVNGNPAHQHANHHCPGVRI